MPINSPDIFFGTIASASAYIPTGSVLELEQDVFVYIEGGGFNTITPKNISADLNNSIDFTAKNLGNYFVNFNATAVGGKDRNYTIAPFINDSEINVGQVQFRQQNIAGERVPYYEISSTFLIALQKNDKLNFYVKVAGTPPTDDFSINNMNVSLYQLDQIGVH